MTDLAASRPEAQEKIDLRDPALYFNRELSWLDFNDRVLQLAEDRSAPLLERLKFCAIWSTNLDEFFMVRVAGLHDQVDAGIDKPGQDGLTPAQTISRIRDVVRAQQLRASASLHEDVQPALGEHGIRIVRLAHVTKQQRELLNERFHRQIFPVLTPLAVGLGRPFPYISNLSLSLAVLVRDPSTGHQTFARVKVPKEVLPRFLDVGDCTFVPIEEVIAANLERLFPGMEILEYAMFRVTRDADFEISDEADDLLSAVEAELRRRRFGEVVRVEVGDGMLPGMRRLLVEALGVEPDDVFVVDGLMALADLWSLYGLHGDADLREKPWTPVIQPRLQEDEGTPPDVLAAM